jgi:hypothetical protein
LASISEVRRPGCCREIKLQRQHLRHTGDTVEVPSMEPAEAAIIAREMQYSPLLVPAA